MTLIGTVLDKLQTPELAGSFYTRDIALRRKIGVTMRDALYQTHRYHLSAQATELAAMYAFNVDNIDEQILKIARPAFSSVWLEWPLVNQLGAAGLTPHESAPEMVGVLVKTHPEGYIITDVFCVNDVVVYSPISVLYNPTFPIDYKKYDTDTEFFCDCIKHSHDDSPLWYEEPGDLSNVTVRAVLSKCLIGGSKLENGLNQKFYNILTAPHAIHILTPGVGKIMKTTMENMDAHNRHTLYAFKEIITERITETAGMFKFVIGALALMNTPKYVERKPIKPGTRNPSEPKTKSTKKRNPVYDYVELKIPHTVIIQELQGRGWNKRQTEQYEVAGHHCHSHKLGDPKCNHIYANQTETKEICLLCGAKRWWRKDHHRGDPELGIRHKSSKLVIKGNDDE